MWPTAQQIYESLINEFVYFSFLYCCKARKYYYHLSHLFYLCVRDKAQRRTSSDGFAQGQAAERETEALLLLGWGSQYMLEPLTQGKREMKTHDTLF